MDTVVFDLDGTLLNTLDDLMDSVNFALTQFGFPTRTYAEVRQFVGNGVRKLVERSLPAEHVDMTDAVLVTFSAHYDKNKNNKTAPYPGILAMLHAVKAAGYKTAIVSNKYESAVKELVENVFTGTIDVAVGERPGVAPKPAPDGVFEALHALHTEPKDAVYVGDSDIDVATARNAGLPVIGVTWGFRDRSLLTEKGADRIVDAPRDILAAVRSLG